MHDNALCHLEASKEQSRGALAMLLACMALLDAVWGQIRHRWGGCGAGVAHRASKAGGFKIALAGAVKVQGGLSIILRLAGVHAGTLLLKVEISALLGRLNHLCFAFKALLRGVTGISFSPPSNMS